MNCTRRKGHDRPVPIELPQVLDEVTRQIFEFMCEACGIDIATHCMAIADGWIGAFGGSVETRAAGWNVRHAALTIR